MLVEAGGQNLPERGTEAVCLARREAQRRHQPEGRRSDRIDEDPTLPQRDGQIGRGGVRELDPEQEPGYNNTMIRTVDPLPLVFTAG